MSLLAASANCSAMPAVACLKILSPEGLKAWWIGKVTITFADTSWPATGSKLSWKAGGGIFKAEIKIDARPQYVEMMVITPSADSIIRHTFEELPNGGTKYTKSVEPKWRSGFAKLFGPLFNSMILSMVRREVKKAASFADQETV